jgi:hypothetical protein
MYEIWKCNHPIWTETCRLQMWAGNNTGDPPPIDAPVTIYETCTVCGVSRQRVKVEDPSEENRSEGGSKTWHGDLPR